MNQTFFYTKIPLIIWNKYVLERIVLTINLTQDFYEVERVGRVKRAMLKTQESLQVRFFMIDYKVIRSVIH